MFLQGNLTVILDLLSLCAVLRPMLYVHISTFFFPPLFCCSSKNFLQIQVLGSAFYFWQGSKSARLSCILLCAFWAISVIFSFVAVSKSAQILFFLVLLVAAQKIFFRFLPPLSTSDCTAMHSFLSTPICFHSEVHIHLFGPLVASSTLYW